MWLNLAQTEFDVTTLGPGRRVAIWVQGCPFRCAGCIAPDWQPLRPNKLVEVEHLAQVLLSAADHHGMTFSGGEPMLQAKGLLALWRAVRSRRVDWTLIVFSGFRRTALLRCGQPEQRGLLAEADAFIGGPYLASQNDGRGLRGSANQEIWFPPQSQFDAEQRRTLRDGCRQVELRAEADQVLMIGVPQLGWRRSSPPGPPYRL